MWTERSLESPGTITPIVLGMMVLALMDFDGPTRLNQDADQCKTFVRLCEQ